MAFDYQRDTKDHYQSAEIASAYHAEFANGHGWHGFRGRTVAARERTVVGQFLRRVPHGRILDLPVGTGKLAPVFATLGGSVVACDIAPAMLDIARREYAAAECSDVAFRICDAAHVVATLGERFDVAVCLRLLHRVPPDVRGRILAQLAACAGYAIVSMGIETDYHWVRRQIRDRVMGGGTDVLCYERPAAVRLELSSYFEIVAQKWILPLLSQEKIFLLRPKT